MAIVIAFRRREKRSANQAVSTPPQTPDTVEEKPRYSESESV